MFFLKKNIVWILQQVCKFPKNFGLHFKNIIFFILFLLIHEIINLCIRYILDIK
jgi:hypothetical protein